MKTKILFLLLIAIFAACFGAALVVASTILVHPVSAPRRNEKRVISLLMGARAQLEGCCVSSVDLRNGVILVSRPGNN